MINKKILVFDNALGALAKKEERFQDIFKRCDYATSMYDALHFYNNDMYNAIIINISDNAFALEFIVRIKKISKNKPIVIISDAFDLKKINIVSSLYVDGILYEPFSKKNLTNLMSNIFERQEEQDMLFTYLKEIEKAHEKAEIKKEEYNKSGQVTPSPVAQKHVKIENYENHHVMSAIQLFNEFDETALDKVELLQDHINSFDELNHYLILDRSDKDAVAEIFLKMSIAVEQISRVLFYFQYFKIAVKAFDELSVIFQSINVHRLSDQNLKKLVDFLSYVEIDTLKWIENVFIDRSAKDIFYFDSSLLSNVETIRAIGNNEEVSSENEIEFF